MRPDHPHENLPELLVVPQFSVLEMQKRHLLDTHDFGRPALFLLPDIGQNLSLHIRIIRSLIATRAYNVGDIHALAAPFGYRSTASKVHIIRMGADHQDLFRPL